MINRDYSAVCEVDFLQIVSKKAVRGLAWVFFTRIGDKVLWLVKIIVLARMLLPSDFGLMGLALLVMFFFNLFSQTGGFCDFLVQKREFPKIYLDIVWTIQVIEGIIFAAAFFFFAPAIAIFFKVSGLVPVLKTMSLGFFISGFSNIAIIFFRKHLDFHKELIYQISGTITDLLVSIVLIFIIRNVWVLVFGFLSSISMKFILSYILIPYKPAFQIKFDRIKEVFHFGKWIIANRFLNFLSTQGVDLFVGKILSAASLGLYQMSYRFSNSIVSEFSAAITQVAFPAYAKMQDSLDLLSSAYMKVIKFSAIFAVAAGVNLFIFAQDIIRIFFGQKWMQMENSFRIFALISMFFPVITASDALFVGKGKPRLTSFFSLVKISIIAILILPLTKIWGVSGAAIVILLSLIIIIPFWIIYSLRETNKNAIDFIKVLWPPAFGGVAMFFLSNILKNIFPQLNIFTLMLVVFLNIFLFIAVLFIVGKVTDYKLIKDIKFLMRNLK